MSSIYVELKAGSGARTINKSMKKGNTYVFYVNENFDIKNRNDLGSLIGELNSQLKRDRIEPVQVRDVERDLSRLVIGGRVDVKID